MLFLVSCSSLNFKERKIAATSYPWNGNTVANMLRDLNDIGISEVVMFSGQKLGEGKFADAEFSPGMGEEEMKAAKELFESYGVRPIGYAHAKAAEGTGIKEIFSFAKFFGMEIMSVEPPESSLPEYDKYAGKTGIKVGLYNHKASRNTPYSTPRKMLSILRSLKNVKTFPDCGQWYRSGLEAPGCVRLLKDKMIAVYLQDRDSNDVCVPLGEGKADVKGVLSELDSQRFDGKFVIMHKTKSDALEEVRRSAEFLRNN